ncbi:hypothetical protein Holit_03201 [Hollandina sp. SP2]
MAQGTSFNMEEAFARLDFHSLRLKQRFINTMGTRAQHPDQSVWEASKNRAEASD